MSPPRALLLVEGTADLFLVRCILTAAGLPVDQVDLRVSRGKEENLSSADSSDITVALIDLDETSVPDARARARQQLGDPPFEVFCAVPTVEAWLFADEQLAEAQCANDPEALAILRRIPLPEEIPNPKELSRTLFGLPQHCGWLREMNVRRAAARSPSLRAFLVRMGELLHTPVPTASESVSRSLSRSVLAGLIAEVLPSETVVWRTMDGDTYTAIELRKHIEAGDEVGQQYASDLLRVSRDVLQRAANREKSR